MAYATLAEGLDAEQLERLDEEIGMKESPEEIAKKALRAHQEAMGMVFDDPDAPVPAPLGSQDEEIPGEVLGSRG